MTEYILEHDKGVIIATYSKGGKLKRLDAKKGFICDAKGYVFAQEEKDIEREFWKPYHKQKDPFFSTAQSYWLSSYKERTELSYRFKPQCGKALKEIGKHLTEISGNTEQALQTWYHLCKKWNTLPDFYRNKPELTFVNSQLNTILNLLKNGKQTSETASCSAADDLRRSFQS